MKRTISCLSKWVYDSEQIFNEFMTRMMRRMFRQPTLPRLVDPIKNHTPFLSKLDDSTDRYREGKYIPTQKLIPTLRRIPLVRTPQFNADFDGDIGYVDVKPGEIDYDMNEMEMFIQMEREIANMILDMRRRDPAFIRNSWPGYEFLISRMKVLETLTLDEVMILDADYDDFRNYYIERAGLKKGRYSIYALDEDHRKIVDRKRELFIASDFKAASFYINPFVFTDTTKTINGYKLYSTILHPFKLEWDEFLEVANKCIQIQPTSDEFREWLNVNLSNKWSKITSEGVRVSESKHVKRHKRRKPWRDHNIKELLKLPYPPLLIQWTILTSRDNDLKCVRYSNIQCYVVEQYIIRVGLFSLTDLCKFRMNCQKSTLPNL